MEVLDVGNQRPFGQSPGVGQGEAGSELIKDGRHDPSHAHIETNRQFATYPTELYGPKGDNKCQK